MRKGEAVTYTRDQDATIHQAIACGRVSKPEALTMASDVVSMALGFDLAGPKFAGHALTCLRFSVDVREWAEGVTTECEAHMEQLELLGTALEGGA
jgi:hypothetical protein